MERRHAAILKKVKSLLPRRESERRVHQLARHSDILTTVETRISMLRMTFMKYIDVNACCFIPGKVIDEILRILTLVENTCTPPRTHEVLQELRDISSMAMEHFDEKIVPNLKMQRLFTPSYSIPGLSTFPPPIIVKDTFRKDFEVLQHRNILQRQQIGMLKQMVGKLSTKVKRHACVISSQSAKIREQSSKLKQQDTTIAELKRHVEEWDLKFSDLVAELNRARDGISPTKTTQTTKQPNPSSTSTHSSPCEPPTRFYKTNIKPRTALPRSLSRVDLTDIERKRKLPLSISSLTPIPPKLSRMDFFSNKLEADKGMLNTFQTMLGRPRCRNWIPLATQQLRLRHLVRVMAYNLKTVAGSLYYTLHFTTMCAPFYTSEKLESANPKWAELDLNTLQYSSAPGVVLRIWHHEPGNLSDKVILAWGVCLPGLVYLGAKLSDIQPVSFNENSVIFELNGGYFTSQHCIRTDCVKPLPFIDYLNVLSDGDSTSIIRNASVKCAKSDVRLSYNVRKLQRLHNLQQSIKNKTLDAQELREKISVKCGLIEGAPLEANPLRETSTASTYNSHLLSMTTLNKLLNKQEQPTRLQRQEIARIRKLIETARFRTKLLSQERDRKLANLRKLNQRCNHLLDTNEDKNSELMSLYRQLSREIERLREWRRSQTEIREMYVHTSAQLYLRRKQLVNELLLIYPIQKESDNKYTISGVHLPDSENLNVAPENSLSVALGYVSHVVVMCSTFLQVPLRYPLIHLGSKSKISDHITYNIPAREREFPLYTRGKDRLQFQYAVYLLNKNIAQLRWYCGLPTADLRATLPNLLTLLQGNTDYRYDRPDSGFSSARLLTSAIADTHSDPAGSIGKKYGSFSALEASFIAPGDRICMPHTISSSCEQIFPSLKSDFSPIRRTSRTVMSESGPGLSQILTNPNTSFKIRDTSILDKHKLGVGEEPARTASPDVNDTLIDDNDDKSENNVIKYVDALIENASDTCVEIASQANNLISNACVDCNIEQGMDILDAANDMCVSHSFKEQADVNGTEPLKLASKLKHRVSRSVGSYTDEDKFSLNRSNVEGGSDPLLAKSDDNPEGQLSDQSLPNSLGDGRKDFLQHWFDSSPALVASEENLCPEEFLGTVSQPTGDEVLAESALTERTEALVERNSTFHLVKPKD